MTFARIAMAKATEKLPQACLDAMCQKEQVLFIVLHFPTLSDSVAMLQERSIRFISFKPTMPKLPQLQMPSPVHRFFARARRDDENLFVEVAHVKQSK